MNNVFTKANGTAFLLIVLIAGAAILAANIGGLSQPSAVRVGMAGSVAIIAWRVIRSVAVGDVNADAESQRAGFERAALMADTGAGPRPEELDRLESVLIGVISGASDMHVRLRPDMREIAVDRLRTKRGIDLDTNPEAARRLLGDQLYDIVRPDRPPMQDRGSAGVPATVIEAMVAALEAL